MESLPSPGRDRPPLWAVLGTLVGASLFVGFVIVWVPWTLSGWTLRPPLFIGARWLGGTLIVLALPVLASFLERFLVAGHGTPVPIAPPSRLVVSGPFRFVRNPSYVGAIAAIAGQGLLVGSTQVLLYAAAIAVGFHLSVVLYEEPTLRGKFGDAYEAYCRDVPRWIPRFGRGVKR